MDQVNTAPAPETSTPSKPAENLSLAEALDAALGKDSVFPVNGNVKSITPEPAATPAPKEQTESPKATETPKVPEAPKTKTETEKPDSAKTPSSVLDKLGKLGLAQAVESVDTPEKKEVVEENKEPTTPASQTAFAKLTKELREAKSRLKEFETKSQERTEEVEAGGDDTASDDQLNDYKSKVEKFEVEKEGLEKELRIFRVESTKEFKQTITEPIAKASAEITEALATYEVKPGNVLDAANEVDALKRRQKVKELTADLDPVDALLIRSKVEEISKLNLKKEEIVKDSKTVLEQMEQREREAQDQQKASYDKEAKKAFSEVWDTFQEQMPLLQKIEGNETWNKTVDSVRLEAERLDNEPLDHRSRASLTYQAVALPLVVQIFKEYISKSNKEVSELKTTLGEYRKATPGVASGQVAGVSKAPDAGLSFLDALEKGL